MTCPILPKINSVLPVTPNNMVTKFHPDRSSLIRDIVRTSLLHEVVKSDLKRLRYAQPNERIFTGLRTEEEENLARNK